MFKEKPRAVYRKEPVIKIGEAYVNKDGAPLIVTFNSDEYSPSSQNHKGFNETAGLVDVSIPYPNPAKETFNIAYELPGDDITVTITVYDIAGREVYKKAFVTEAGGNVETVETSELANGVYVVRVKAGGEDAAVKMVVAR